MEMKKLEKDSIPPITTKQKFVATFPRLEFANMDKDANSGTKSIKLRTNQRKQ
jgi:hypothetical protein